MTINTQEVLDKVLEEGKTLLEDLYKTIDSEKANLLRSTFSNLTSLVKDYALARISGDNAKASIKLSSIEHSLSAIFTVSLLAVNDLVGEAKRVGLSRLIETLTFFASKLIQELTAIQAGK